MLVQSQLLLNLVTAGLQEVLSQNMLQFSLIILYTCNCLDWKMAQVS